MVQGQIVDIPCLPLMDKTFHIDIYYLKDTTVMAYSAVCYLPRKTKWWESERFYYIDYKLFRTCYKPFFRTESTCRPSYNWWQHHITYGQCSFLLQSSRAGNVVVHTIFWKSLGHFKERGNSLYAHLCYITVPNMPDLGV